MLLKLPVMDRFKTLLSILTCAATSRAGAAAATSVAAVGRCRLTAR